MMNEYIAERYLASNGYGNPAPLAFCRTKNPIWRFWVYVKSMFTAVNAPAQHTEVQAVFGLNCAFRASVLREVGGYDESLLADEDSEMSTRLRQSGARIIYSPEAVIHHRHRESLIRLIRQTYRRSQYTVNYYVKENKILPIFPIPLLYVAIALFIIVFYPIPGMLFVILGPLALYCWWLIRAFRELKFEYLVYGYIQLTLELAAVLGITRGKMTNRRAKLV